MLQKFIIVIIKYQLRKGVFMLKRKLAVLGVVCISVLSLAACGSKNSSESTKQKVKQSSSSQVQEKKIIDYSQLLNDYKIWVDKSTNVVNKYKTDLNNLGVEMYKQTIKAYDPNAVGPDGVAGGALPDMSEVNEKTVELNNAYLEQCTTLRSEASTLEQKVSETKAQLSGDDLVKFNNIIQPYENQRSQLLSEMQIQSNN